MAPEEQEAARRLMQSGTVDTGGGHDGPHPPSAASVALPEAEPEVPVGEEEEATP